MCADFTSRVGTLHKRNITSLVSRADNKLVISNNFNNLRQFSKTNYLFVRLFFSMSGLGTILKNIEKTSLK